MNPLASPHCSMGMHLNMNPLCSTGSFRGAGVGGAAKLSGGEQGWRCYGRGAPLLTYVCGVLWPWSPPYSPMCVGCHGHGVPSYSPMYVGCYGRGAPPTHLCVGASQPRISGPTPVAPCASGCGHQSRPSGVGAPWLGPIAGRLVGGDTGQG